MRAILVLVSFVVLVAAVQDNLNNQGALFTEELTKELLLSNVGRTILKLALLQGKAKQVDFSRLFSALDDLADSLRERKTEENTLFDRDSQQSLSDNSFYSNQITEYSQEIAQNQVALEELNQSRDNSQVILSQKIQDLSKTKEARQELQNTIDQDETDTNDQIDFFNDIINSIDKALEIVQEVNYNPDMLIEESHTDIRVVKAFIQKEMKAIMEKSQISYPLAEILIEMTYDHKIQDHSQQESVRDLVKTLNDQRAQFVEKRDSSFEESRNQRDSNLAILSKYDESISLLDDDIIPNLQTDVETKTGQIDVKNTLLKDAQANFVVAQDNFDNLESRWTQRQNLFLHKKNRQVEHTNLINNYDREIQILSQVDTALARGGIQRNN